MGIFWFRVHNWWALHLRRFFQEHDSPEAENDEFLFNRARQFTIATYQVRFIDVLGQLNCVLILFYVMLYHCVLLVFQAAKVILITKIV